MKWNEFSLTMVLSKALEETSFTRDEIKFLLSLKDDSEVELLHRVARLVRNKRFGSRVFLYGFVYFSTHCRNNCVFCNYRRDNSAAERYRKSEAEILQSAAKLARSGVHLIDLTMGEDPIMFDSEFGLKRLSQLIESVGEETGLPIMISPGAVPEQGVAMFGESGADWFACYQETHNRNLFNTLRIDQSYDERFQRKAQARKEGMLIEEGILTGVGESLDDITDSIIAMRDMEVDQARVMTFVPLQNTPMADYPIPDDRRERIIISVLRLVMPDALIPASLDIDGLNGLQKRLQAGANVVTSIVVPGHGLKGVANSDLDIEESRRTVESIGTVLQFTGLEAATQREYQEWLAKQKHKKNVGASAEPSMRNNSWR